MNSLILMLLRQWLSNLLVRPWAMSLVNVKVFVLYLMHVIPSCLMLLYSLLLIMVVSSGAPSPSVQLQYSCINAMQHKAERFFMGVGSTFQTLLYPE